MTKKTQLSYYKVTLGIDAKVKKQKDFDRPKREKELLRTLELELEIAAREEGLELGDAVQQLAVAALQAKRHQRIVAEAYLETKSIHELKQSARLFRDAFYTLVCRAKDNDLIVIEESLEDQIEQSKEDVTEGNVKQIDGKMFDRDVEVIDAYEDSVEKFDDLYKKLSEDDQ